MNKAETLKHYFGHDGFRPGQETLVDALLEGRDCLGIMPTGAGKSMCYQVPALMKTGIALVISMGLSSIFGTAVPLLFKQLNIDPAVASGPLITTINDLVAVVAYYGLAWLLLVQKM